MTPGDADRRPVSDESGESSSNGSSSLARRSQDRTQQPWHTSAHAYRVVGVRGRERLVLVVTSCPYCRCSHVHSAQTDFASGRRTASCHGGRYVVLLRDGAS